MDFVSGGTGLIGSHLLLLLATDGPVRAGKRENSRIDFVEKLFAHHGKSSSFQNIEWVDFEITNPSSVESALVGIERVYHCAALVSFFSNDESALIDINVAGTRHMINAAIQNGVKKFLHVSSTGAIGRQNSEEVNEEMKWKRDMGNSVYSKSKHLGELEVWRGAEEGLSTVIVNPCIVLGPAADYRSSAAMVENARKGQRFFTPGSNAFVDARDVAQVMHDLMISEIENQRFLIVARNQKYKEVFSALAKAFGKAAPDRSIPRWMAEIAWRVEMLRSFFAGSKPLLTKETVDSAFHKVQYSGEKLKSAIGYDYRSFQDTIEYLEKSQTLMQD